MKLWYRLPVHYARKFFGDDLVFSESEDDAVSIEGMEEEPSNPVERWEEGQELEGQWNDGHYYWGSVTKVYANGNYSFEYVCDLL